ncbi:O-antigen translocase [Flavobacterium salilacus subsp. salilacus]|uniref:O-antigen translocase n=1 Tax=Flavobacterium TaxID=237 RepID=UPI001074B732|nr:MULTISPECIES: O-antigen translocase [Flavobacterium]KAF2516897.1 O-antigen translocase [Flavobacterium salilacus subsp. salilacus]MBE1615743.1 O-antigen translocase [Flavobacterium sp. SaA2.13]
MKFIKSILDNPTFKVSSLSTVSVLIRIAGGLLASKMIAVFIGPAGLALTGNFRNFIRQAEIFGTLGFENGIIKYVAENENDENKKKRVITTVFYSVLTAIIVLSVLLLLFAGYLNILFFGEKHEYDWIFRITILALPWYIGNLIFVSILNGLSLYKKVIKINIWGNVTGVLLSAVLIWQFGVPGALLGLIISPSLMFLLSFYLIKKELGGFSFLSVKNFDKGILKSLSSYSLMSFVTTAIGPLVAVSIRTHLIDNYSEDEAGFWEAITRISFFYLMFVSTLLTVYFFPKLSAAKTDKETHVVFLDYYKTIVPVFGLGLILIFVLKGFIVRLLFDEDFLPMTNLFLWQLAGDFLKVCALILGYEFFAKKMTRAFIITDILSYIILYFSSHYFIQLYGSEGAVMGHAVTYFIYLLVLGCYFRKKLFR